MAADRTIPWPQGTVHRTAWPCRCGLRGRILNRPGDAPVSEQSPPLFWLAAAYLLVGAALFKPSRAASALGKTGYFLAFPVHAIAIPVAAGLGEGTASMLQSRGFWAA